MMVTLYTSRVMLHTLGVQDFGIFNLVAGVITMFQFLNSALTDATQRYLSFELGKNQDQNVSKVFSACMLLHFLLALVIVIVAEPIGLWFINNMLKIPSDRIIAAEWIFHFSVLSMFIVFISVPYNALIIANEKMKAFAMISIVDAFLRLIIAYALILSKTFDKLILYGILILSLHIFIRLIYTIYSKRKFKGQASLIYSIDYTLLKQMGGFASWTIIGNVAYIGVTQGLNVLLGMFFLPLVNAARAIAVQVQTAISTFVRNFQTAINPQITKTFANGEYSATHNLIFRGARFSFFLFMIPLIPLFLETEVVLKIWLAEVPDYTTQFVRIILFVSAINCLGNSLSVGAKASGRIRDFELYAASVKILVLPISYVFLRMGFSPTSIFYVLLVMEALALICNVWISHKLIHFNLPDYYHNVITKVVLVFLCSFIPIFILHLLGGASIVKVVLLFLTSFIWSLFVIFKIGLTGTEKFYVIAKINSICRMKIKNI